jgi:MoaA/NifB/PqqE/SkfB family radical SAM enzyme
MDIEMFARILDNLPPVGFVTLHGIGEPTLHPEFNEIVSMADRSGKFQKMKMTTNALTRSVEYYKKSVLAGLDEFWVSVDSLDQDIAEKMRSGTKVEKLKRRIGDLCAEELPVHISMVVSAINYKDIPETLRQLYELGKPPVHIQEFQDFGNDYGLMTRDQRQELLHELKKVAAELPGMYIQPPNYLRPQGNYCSAPWFRPAITVQGYMTPCCTTFDPGEFDYINLGEMSFAQAWKQPGILNWVKQFLQDKTEICQGCGLNPRNFGMENVLGVSGKSGLEKHVVKQ